MLLYTLLASSAILPALVLAHGEGFGGPKLFGVNAIADLKSKNIFTGPLPPAFVKRKPSPEVQGSADANANTDGQCGAGFNPSSCAPGYCCSPAGYCGIGPDYCNGPDCQLDYGPGCDANKIPSGANTSSIPRPVLGSVSYGGAGIYRCTVPGTIALTYDDGPYIYTSYILDLLKSYHSKATFFITANNNGKGEIDDPSTIYPAIIKRMQAEGHQIASHTWTHQDLSKVTPTQRRAQMIKTEMALRNILGFFPTYMRPPYSSCDAPSGCEADMTTLGYHVTYFDVDTNDYNLDSPNLIQQAKDNFANGIKGTASTSQHLVIEHDIHEQTAHNLTQYMLTTLLAAGYKAVTVGQCLGDPQANWYRSSSGAGAIGSGTASSATGTSSASTGSASASGTAAKPITTDATCGPSSGFTCQGSQWGNCCSQHGYCGSTTDYCGTGCQPGYGTCSGFSSASVSGSSSKSSSFGVSGSLSSSRSFTTAVSATITPRYPSTTFSTSRSTSTSTASTVKSISTTGSCGNGVTCQGSSFGSVRLLWELDRVLRWWMSDVVGHVFGVRGLSFTIAGNRALGASGRGKFRNGDAARGGLAGAWKI